MTFFNKLKQEITGSWMGLHLFLGIAIVSLFLHGLINQPVLCKSISEILVAVLLGFCIGNAFPLRKELSVGAKFALQRLLRLGIILLSLRRLGLKPLLVGTWVVLLMTVLSLVLNLYSPLGA